MISIAKILKRKQEYVFFHAGAGWLQLPNGRRINLNMEMYKNGVARSNPSHK